MRTLDKDLLHVSVIRSLYLRLRFGGDIVVLRGTRLRIDRGAHIEVPPGCRLVIGRHHAGGAPASVDLRRNARLTITGSMLKPRDTAFKSALTAEVEAHVWPLIGRGALTPVIYKILPLAAAAEAQQLMESSEHIGKILLRV